MSSKLEKKSVITKDQAKTAIKWLKDYCGLFAYYISEKEVNDYLMTKEPIYP